MDDTSRHELQEHRRRSADAIVRESPGTASAPDLIRVLSERVARDVAPELLLATFAESRQLSLLTLRVANSPVWTRDASVRSLVDIIDSVDHPSDLLELAVIVCCIDRFRDIELRPPFDRTGLWNHSARASRAARLLVEKAPAEYSISPRNAGTAGFIDSIGHLVLAEHERPAFNRALQESACEGNSLASVEVEMFGADAHDIVLSLMNHWNLPDELEAAILQTGIGQSNEPTTKSLIATANTIASQAAQRLDAPRWVGAPPLLEDVPSVAEEILEDVLTVDTAW